ncbi:MAG TPA: hypothetical protein VF580_06505, partial [Thermoanaerobaculia bacterium]
EPLPLEPEETVAIQGTSFLPLVGRTLLVLGGAFLIRALTDDGKIPPAAGVGLGLLYAAVMGVLADRARGAAERWSAVFHGLSATMIALPLIVEATTRFKVLSPIVGAIVLSLFTVFLVGVAWRRDSQCLAWVATLGSLAAILALVFSTHAVATFSVVLIGLGTASLWLTYGQRWHALRWPLALAADLVVSLMAYVAAHPGGLPEGYGDLSIPGVLAIALALPVAYLGSFAVRTLMRMRSVTVFELVQTVLALLAGFGGAVRVAWTFGSGSTALGVSALVVAGGCYFVAFSFVERRAEFRGNFLFYSTLAVLLTLAVSPLVFGTNLLVLFWCGLGFTAALLGFRLNRISLAAHSAAYVAAAGIFSGLFGGVIRTFLGGAAHGFSFPGRDALVVVATAVASYTALSVKEAGAAGPRTKLERLPVAFLGVVAVVGIGGGAIDLLSLAFGTSGAGAAPRLATIRTAVLSTAAIALAWARRRPFCGDLVWLPYPVLVAGGLKLVLEDLRTSGPAALVIAFGFYGAALIMVPRLLRRTEVPGGPPA